MRLWHKDLISVLPDKQLLGQWRECCAIASNIANKGTPNHILVNKIMNYPLDHFYNYGVIVYCEMDLRGFKCDFQKFEHWFTYPTETKIIDRENIFAGWHNDRYLAQCYHNLQEKFDCGGIDAADWNIIDWFYWTHKV